MQRVKINYELDARLSIEAEAKIRKVHKEHNDAIQKLLDADKPKPKFKPIQLCHLTVDADTNHVLLSWRGNNECVNTTEYTGIIIEALQKARAFVDDNKN